MRTILTHVTEAAESIRVPSNDERRAEWAHTYFRAGLHRNPIQDCPQPETPIRERAYAPGQEDAK